VSGPSRPGVRPEAPGWRTGSGAVPDRSGPLLARLYDWEHDSFAADVELYAQLTRRTGGPVLEPACGTGRVLEPLAQRGLHVFGFDSSPDMLARARKRLDGLEKATVTLADLQDPLPDGPFGLVILALNSLGFIADPNAQIDLLGRIGAQMAHDAVLALDLVNAGPLSDQPQGLPVLQQTGPDEEVGAAVTKWIVQRLHPATQQLTMDCFYDLLWPDGTLSRVEDHVSLRYFFRYEVELLLSAAGLRVESMYGDYGLESFQDESPRMIVLAVRA
jgi:SAM-dependent methyltransferase